MKDCYAFGQDYEHYKVKQGQYQSLRDSTEQMSSNMDSLDQICNEFQRNEIEIPLEDKINNKEQEDS